MYIKNYNLKKEVGIAIKITNSNQSQKIPMHHAVLATVITQSQMQEIKHSLAHLQGLIPTFAGIRMVYR